jgi:hypothetical protein
MFGSRRSSAKLRFEGLEGRLMMAGNVTANVLAGNLVITGDRLANGVSIVGSAVPGEFVIQGIPTSCVPTTVNGKRSVTVEHVQNIAVDLKAGNDILRIGNAKGDVTRIPGALTVDRGPGDKTLLIANVSIGGIANLATGTGNDQVTLTNVTARRSFALDAGAGDDTVRIRDSLFRDSLLASLDGGDDALEFKGNTVRKTGRLDGGPGRDTLNANWRRTNSGGAFPVGFEAHV